MLILNPACIQNYKAFQTLRQKVLTDNKDLPSSVSVLPMCPLCLPNCRWALSSSRANVLTCLYLCSAFISKTHLVFLFQNALLFPICLSKNPWSLVQDQPQEVMPVYPPPANTAQRHPAILATHAHLSYSAQKTFQSRKSS